MGGKLDNFEAEFTRLERECAAEFRKLELDFDEVITLTIDKAPLTKKRDLADRREGQS